MYLSAVHMSNLFQQFHSRILNNCQIVKFYVFSAIIAKYCPNLF